MKKGQSLIGRCIKIMANKGVILASLMIDDIQKKPLELIDQAKAFY